MIPEEIFEEFQVEDIAFDTAEREGTSMVEWKSFETIVRDKVGSEGIFQYDLVKKIQAEIGGNKEVIRRKIKNFVKEHNDKYRIVPKPVFVERMHPFVEHVQQK